MDNEIKPHCIGHFNIREKDMEKRHTAQGRRNKKDADTPINQLIDIDEGVDLRFILFRQRAIQVEYNHLLKAELSKGEGAQYRGEGGVQSQ